MYDSNRVAARCQSPEIATEFDPFQGFLDKKQLGKLLGLHPNSVDNLRARKVIPAYKIAGGAVRFRYEEVLKALERYKVREVSL
jgi:excisionase family DNA binding protein